MLNIRSANMNLKMACLTFLLAIVSGFAVLPVFPSAAAESRSNLTCNVTQQPDGFSYRLSRPPSSPECTSCWELKNKTVVARNLENLTQHSCQPYLHYTRDCPDIWEHAHCEFNCSQISDLPTTTVNSTLICITESLCLSKLTFGLGVAGIIILLVVLGAAAMQCQKRRIGAHRRASYTPANGKDAMEEREMVEVKDII